MEEVKNRFDEILCHGLSFVLRLALVLGGLGFASVLTVALLVGGIYLIATGHPTGGYTLVAGAIIWGCIVLSLIIVAATRKKSSAR